MRNNYRTLNAELARASVHTGGLETMLYTSVCPMNPTNWIARSARGFSECVAPMGFYHFAFDIRLFDIRKWIVVS